MYHQWKNTHSHLLLALGQIMSLHLMFHLKKTPVSIPNEYTDIIKLFEVFYYTTWDNTKQGRDSKRKEDIGYQFLFPKEW